MKSSSRRSLSELLPGESATIAETPVSNERLAEMGFVKGEVVELVKFSPFGDPAVVKVLGSAIVVRRADLAGVLVIS